MASQIQQNRMNSEYIIYTIVIKLKQKVLYFGTFLQYQEEFKNKLFNDIKLS